MTAHEIWQQFRRKWSIQDLFWFVCKTWCTSFACDNLLYLAGKTKGFSHGPVKLSGRNSQEISAIRLNIQRQKTNKNENSPTKNELMLKILLYFTRNILARRIKNLETPLTSLRWLLLRQSFSFFVYLGFWWCVATEHWSFLLIFSTVSGRNQGQPHLHRVPLMAEGGNIPTCHQVGTMKTP